MIRIWLPKAKCPISCPYYDNDEHFAYCHLPDGKYEIEIQNGHLLRCPLGYWKHQKKNKKNIHVKMEFDMMRLIKISEKTYQLLENIKNKHGYENYDKLIQDALIVLYISKSPSLIVSSIFKAILTILGES